MKNAQTALCGMKQIPSIQKYGAFLTLIIMATNPSAEIDGEQDEFLHDLIHDLIDREQTTVAEARNTAVWLNTFRQIQ